MNQQNEVDIVQFYTIIKRRIKTIVMISLITALSLFIFTKLFVSKQYVSSGTIIVNSRKEDGNNSITNDEINSAKGLTSVYSIIIKSDPIMQNVIDNLNLDYTATQLQSKITVNSIDSTQVMKITAKTKNAETSARIVNEILSIAPDNLIDKVEAGSVKVISEGKINKRAVSPKPSRIMILAFLLTLFVSSGFILVYELVDKSIKSETDIETYLGFPLLGIIPNADSVKGAKK